jgi:TolB-like protein/Tfp pilus assembly protein PilF
MSFFAELKRRNVVRVGVAYVIGAWLLLQLTEVLSELLKLPEEIGPIVVAIVAIGFPIALFFAWAFELTPEGVKREKDVDRSQSITPQTGKTLNNTILVMMALAIGYLLFDKFSDKAPDAIPVSNVAKVTTQEESAPAPEAESNRQSIAVLPFENRSRQESDEFFVAGVHDDLLTNLARVSALKVISRTSVSLYKDSKKSIPQIAQELGVATIMEGAVQRSGNTVRINVQLIDAKTDEHLWAEIFDRELTTVNLFAIQSEISEAIADALEATLTDQEHEQINRRPTDILAAYNAYMLGRQLLPKRTSSALALARGEFENAVKLDPDFALAWVGIADAVLLQSDYGTLNPDEAMNITQSAVNRALEINPQLGEAYAVQGQVHQSNSRSSQAEIAYQRAIELSPNYATAYHWFGNMLSSQPSRAREGLALMEKAMELDPLSAIISSSQGWILQQLGEYEQAEAVYLRVIEMNPDFPRTKLGLAYMYSQELGRFDKAWQWSLKSQKLDPGNISNLAMEHYALESAGAAEMAQDSYRRMEELDDKHYMLSVAGVTTNLRNGQIAAAKEQASYLRGTVSAPWARWESGLVLAIDKDYDRARELMLDAEPGYADRNQWARLLNERQQDACVIAWVLMRTGDDALGRELLAQSISYLEDSLPQYIAHADRYSSAACHAALGDVEATLESMSQLVADNHIKDWWLMKIWPAIRPVLDDPRFVALDQKVTDELARQRATIEALAAEQGAGP